MRTEHFFSIGLYLLALARVPGVVEVHAAD